MSLPAALQYMGGLLPGGLPALRDRNHDLDLSHYQKLAEAVRSELR